MSLRCHRALLMVSVALSSGLCPGRVLRVCADPNNLPFSNSVGEGLENKLAQIVAHDLGAQVEYTWWAERKSFVKNSLNAGKCDVVLGIPSTIGEVLATRPYYRSSYVFIWRKDQGLNLSSLTDERLSKMRIGIHVVGDDYAPPALAFARQGWSANLVGYSLFGKDGETDPGGELVRAVSTGDIDAAIVWGPFAGYFANRAPDHLAIAPVKPAMWMGIPFTYEISIGVRTGDIALRNELDRALVRECALIQSLLVEYSIPILPEDETRCDASQRPPSASSR